MLLKTKQLIKYLAQLNPEASFLDRLKIKYRPIVCPFGLLLDQINAEEIIADIGCGSGQFLLLASHFKKPSKVIGIEIHQRLIDQANKLFSEHSRQSHFFTVYDGKSIPDEIAEADKVFIIDVLHHVPAYFQDDFIAEIYSKLKPGAHLLIKDINARSPLVIMNRMHDFIFSGEVGHERKPHDIVKLLDKLGGIQCNFIKLTTFFYPHYFIDVKKA